MKEYIKLLRVKHYVKNLLIFLPSFFAKNLFTVNKFKTLCIGFIAFSLASSIIYIINDIMDLEKDKLHDVKKNRPIASGRISIFIALVLTLVLFICLLFSLRGATGRVFSKSSIYIIAYMMLNFGYSFGLKNIPIVDIMILASGFLLRVLFGASIGSIAVSKWLCLTVIMFSLYMGLGKRRNEFAKTNSDTTRKVLKYYTYDFLDRKMQMCLVLGLVFYSYWTATLTNTLLVGNADNMIWTIPLVIAIVMKYEMTIDQNSYGDPVEVLFSDKILILLVIVYVSVVCTLIYTPFY